MREGRGRFAFSSQCLRQFPLKAARKALWVDYRGSEYAALDQEPAAVALQRRTSDFVALLSVQDIADCRSQEARVGSRFVGIREGFAAGKQTGRRAFVSQRLCNGLVQPGVDVADLCSPPGMPCRDNQTVGEIRTVIDNPTSAWPPYAGSDVCRSVRLDCPPALGVAEGPARERPAIATKEDAIRWHRLQKLQVNCHVGGGFQGLMRKTEETHSCCIKRAFGPMSNFCVFFQKQLRFYCGLMRFEKILREPVRNLPVYQPGKPIEVVARELGLKPDEIIKLASNENPLGACPAALEAISKSLKDLWLYPDNSGWELSGVLAGKLGVDRTQVTLGAGSNELFYLLCDLFVEPGVEVVMGAQAFISYKIATMLAGGTPISVPMPNFTHDLDAMRAAVTERTRLVFLPNPNNPTGTRLPANAVEAFARSLPEHVVFCYDEAYREYDPDPLDVVRLIEEGLPILATRTFSKIYGLAGLRIGYGISSAELATRLNAVRPPFNTSLLAQSAAVAAVKDESWVRKSCEANRKGIEQLGAGFDTLGLEWVASTANFVLVRFDNPIKVADALQQSGIIVRPLKGYDLPDHLRISVGTEPMNARLLEALTLLLK